MHIISPNPSDSLISDSHVWTLQLRMSQCHTQKHRSNTHRFALIHMQKHTETQAHKHTNVYRTHTFTHPAHTSSLTLTLSLSFFCLTDTAFGPGENHMRQRHTSSPPHPPQLLQEQLLTCVVIMGFISTWAVKPSPCWNKI